MFSKFLIEFFIFCWEFVLVFFKFGKLEIEYVKIGYDVKVVCMCWVIILVVVGFWFDVKLDE